MNMSIKGLVLCVVVALLMGYGIIYAVSTVTSVARITVTKPDTAIFNVRWTDRDLDQNQNVTGIIRLNADVFQGNKVTINGQMINGGSSDLTLTWSTENVPSGLTVRLLVNGSSWTNSVVIPRGTTYTLSVECTDDGTLAIGSSIFDLAIVAQ